MANISTSTKFSLNLRDLGQTGLYTFIAMIVGTVLTFLQDLAKTGIANLDWQQLLNGLVFAAVTALTVMIQKFRDDNKIIITDVPTDVIKSIKDNTTTSTVSVQENSNPVLTVTK